MVWEFRTGIVYPIEFHWNWRFPIKMLVIPNRAPFISLLTIFNQFLSVKYYVLYKPALIPPHPEASRLRQSYFLPVIRMTLDGVRSLWPINCYKHKTPVESL